MSPSPPETQTSTIDQGIFFLHRNKGKEHFQRQQLGEAQVELEAAMRMRPEDEQVLNLLGMVYFRLNKLVEAKALYEQLIEKNPSVYNLRSNLGLIYLKQGQYGEAERHFLAAARIEPNNAKAHMYLGLLYERQLKYLEALEQYKLAQNEKMVRQMEQLLQRFAERGEPLPVSAEPVTTARPPSVVSVAEAPAKTPAAPQPLELPEAPAGEIALKIPPVLPEYMKQTDFFNPTKGAETEAHIERALDSAFSDGPQRSDARAPASTPSPPPPALKEPEAVSAGASGQPVVQVAPAEGEHTGPIPVLKPVSLNLSVLSQPSVPHLRIERDEFRIVNKNYLEIEFARGLAASSQRLVGGWGDVVVEPFAGIDGLVSYQGMGRVLMHEEQFRIHLLRLTGERFYIKPGYLLALSPTLRVHWEEPALFRMLSVEGDGMAALAISTSPIVIEIGEGTPLVVDASYLAAVSAGEPISLAPAGRPGFIEVRTRGSALLFPATRT